MPAHQTSFSSLVRSKTAWLALIFVIYSIFGWFIVPTIVEDQLKKNLKELASWDAQVEGVVFNPYSLSLAVIGADIKDSGGESIVAFDRFYVNFQLLSSVTGEISFAEVSLEKPFINVSIGEDGITNFQAAFASDEPEETEAVPDETEEASEPVKLFFGLISIAEGQIKFSDFSQAETFELTLEPVSLALNEFATHNNDDGQYALSISLGDAQKIDWKGQIGIAPFSSKGSLALSGIQASTFWHYAKDASPYWLKQAGISVSGNYDTAQVGEEFQLNIQEGSLTLSDIELSPAEQDLSFLFLKEVSVSPINFDLAKSSLSLGDIVLNEPSVRVIQHSNGELNVTKSLASEASSADTPAEPEVSPTNSEEASKPFEWSINSFSLNQGGVTWIDDALEESANLRLDQLNIKLGTLSHDLSKSFPYDIGFNFAKAPHVIKGEATIDPLVVNGEINVDKLALDSFQAYLKEYSYVDMQDGLASLTGNYQIQQGENLAGTFDGLFRLDQLSVGALDGALYSADDVDTEKDKQFAGWSALVIEPIKLELDPMALTIGNIQLEGPFAKALIDSDGNMNLASLAKESGDTDSEGESEPAEEASKEKSPEVAQAGTTESSKPGPVINIGEVNINGGRFDFSDLSQNPQFATYVSDFGGSIKGLSSDTNAKSAVDFKGKLEDFGLLGIAGTLNPLSDRPNTNLAIDVTNIDLSILSTYSSRYMGYPIDKGKLNLDLDYDIQGSILDANNHVIVDKIGLGGSVDSPDSLGLPLPLALGLLEDTSGTIDINLPISGDMADPSFSAGGIIVTAFTNLITKAITAPFSILGSLVEGGDKLSSVRFQAGKQDLDVSEQAKLPKLAEALKARPSLLLEIRGQASAASDAQALKTQQILADTGNATGTALNQQLESKMRSGGLGQALQTIQQDYPALATGTLPAAEFEAYQQQMLSALAATVELEDVALISLAKARAALLTELLVEGQQIPAERVFNLEPEISMEPSESDTVETLFNLTVR